MGNRLIYLSLYTCLIAALYLLGDSYMKSLGLAKHAQQLLMDNQNQSYQKQVVYIAEEAGHPYWDIVFKGAFAAAKGDIWLDVQGPNKASVDEHVRLIDKAIASQVDGIITQGLDEQFIPIINKAIESGIPVITVDTDAPNSKRIGFMGTNNFRAGIQVGEYLKDK